MDEQATNPNLADLTPAIVSAYVVKNSVRPGDLPSLIAEVHRALISTHAGTIEPEPELLNPAVNPKRSVFPDYIVCLEDGMKFKSLKRHLQTHHEMSPDEYRERWGLAHDYPMGAPNYAAVRSALAKKLGLGQQRGRKKS